MQKVNKGKYIKGKLFDVYLQKSPPAEIKNYKFGNRNS